MIYTVTLNPSLDYIVSVEELKLGMTNRTKEEFILPGGKGINISIVLKNLGFESIALGFTAGFTGEEIKRRLNILGIKNEFISLAEGASRINFKLKSVDGTEINGQGPVINAEEVQRLMEQMDTLRNGDVLFLSGSIPAGVSDDIYKNIMQKLEGRGVLVIVDATKDLLMKVLPYQPFLIKPNHHELGELFQVTCNTREEVVPYAKKLRKRGARNVLVSMAGEGAVLVAEDGRVYELPAPDGTLVNSVGAGDSMVAGFMAGCFLNEQAVNRNFYLKNIEIQEREEIKEDNDDKKIDYWQAFCMGVAAGSASAFSDNLAEGEEIRQLFERIQGNVVYE